MMPQTTPPPAGLCVQDLTVRYGTAAVLQGVSFSVPVSGQLIGLLGVNGSGKTTLTEALVDIFTRRTRLTQVDEGGDFAFEGEITNYTSTTSSVSSDEYALLNRLTITVKVRFTNALDESMSFNRTFTAFEDYESTQLLTEVEGTLIPLIVDKLVTDIFQASAANW